MPPREASKRGPLLRALSWPLFIGPIDLKQPAPTEPYAGRMLLQPGPLVRVRPTYTVHTPCESLTSRVVFVRRRVRAGMNPFDVDRLLKKTLYSLVSHPTPKRGTDPFGISSYPLGVDRPPRGYS